MYFGIGCFLSGTNIIYSEPRRSVIEALKKGVEDIRGDDRKT